jgi:hypothetical protein
MNIKLYYAAFSTATVIRHRKGCGGSRVVNGDAGDMLETDFLWSDRSTCAGTELGAY